MVESDSFDGLMSQLRDGDNGAAAKVFDRYGQRLLKLARYRLRGRIRQKVDPEDVVQSAFRSFFRRAPDESFNFDNWENLWGMLVVITLRKCGKWSEFFYAAKRDINREITEHPSATDRASPSETSDCDPSPSEVAILNETIEQLMHNLKDHEREILSQRLQGYTVQEIAEAVNLTERSVHRVMKRIKVRLDRLCANA